MNGFSTGFKQSFRASAGAQLRRWPVSFVEPQAPQGGLGAKPTRSFIGWWRHQPCLRAPVFLICFFVFPVYFFLLSLHHPLGFLYSLFLFSLLHLCGLPCGTSWAWPVLFSRKILHTNSNPSVAP